MKAQPPTNTCNHHPTLHVALLTLLTIASNVNGHGILSKPSSKSAGTFKVPQDETLTTYFALASFGIIDKAYFDGDHAQTPWTRPGEFSWEHARDLIPGHPQTMHPCGCNAGGIAQCIGVGPATEFGQVTLGAAAAGKPPPDDITPPKWQAGSAQETAWNAYANHSGGYIYMMCKKSTFDACKSTYLPSSTTAQPTREQTNNYLNCVWTCFEDNTLEWVPGSQRVQYQDDVCSYVTTTEMEKVGQDNHIWRFTPIPDTNQITLGGEGVCTWDSVDQFSNAKVKQEFIESFGNSNVCDAGPDQHGPKSWHVIDQVYVPPNLQPGEYLVSWRWDSYMADQLWTGCADVEIVAASTTAANGDSSSSSHEEEEGILQVQQLQDCPSAPPVPLPVPSPVAPPSQPSEPTTASPVISTTDPPTKAPTSTGGAVCTDMELPGNWGANGLYTCDTYYNHGGMAYCAHAVLDESCCFCGGGMISSVIATESPSSSPISEESSAPSTSPSESSPASCDSYVDKSACMAINGCSWRRRNEVCDDALLTSECQQWDQQRNRCKNKGCKWMSGSKKCKGFWG